MPAIHWSCTEVIHCPTRPRRMTGVHEGSLRGARCAQPVQPHRCRATRQLSERRHRRHSAAYSKGTLMKSSAGSAAFLPTPKKGISCASSASAQSREHGCAFTLHVHPPHSVISRPQDRPSQAFSYTAGHMARLVHARAARACGLRAAGCNSA